MLPPEAALVCLDRGIVGQRLRVSAAPRRAAQRLLPFHAPRVLSTSSTHRLLLGRPARCAHTARPSSTGLIRNTRRSRNKRGSLRTEVGYVHRQRGTIVLTLETDDGRLTLDTTRTEAHCESSFLRRIAWLVVGSDDHAREHQPHFQLIASARVHALDPEAACRCLARERDRPAHDSGVFAERRGQRVGDGLKTSRQVTRLGEAAVGARLRRVEQQIPSTRDLAPAARR